MIATKMSKTNSRMPSTPTSMYAQSGTWTITLAVTPANNSIIQLVSNVAEMTRKNNLINKQIDAYNIFQKHRYLECAMAPCLYNAK